MVWTTGQKLYGNRYTIERKLGQGGFGITYLAQNRQGKPVVIKTLKDEVMTSPEFADFRDKYKRDFRDEALRLAVCRHSHIVQIENVFHEQSLPCISMEYVDGVDLWQRVKSGGALAQAEALRYIQQIGDALTIVHDKGLLHRDVKPHNIMVRSGLAEAVLIDFGIAREFIPNTTQHHSAIRTDGFAPVEQYHEAAHRGEYTDVYALAATLYFLLTAKVPPAPFVQISIKNSLTPPQQVNQRVSDTVNQAILTGMALEPKNRPQSVPEWLQLLVPTPPADDLSSERGIDYSRLRDLLAAGNWQEADQETADKMLAVIGKESWWNVTPKDIKNFPCKDLRTIDSLWVKYSNGRFGFSVQKRIWMSVSGQLGKHDYETYNKFGDRVGWYVKEKVHWLYRHDLTFTLKAPSGHLPCWGVGMVRERGWGDRLLSRYAMIIGHMQGLFSRVETCKL